MTEARGGEPAAAGLPPRAAKPAAAGPPLRTGGGVPPVILIIEDDATISDLVAYNLRRAGYEVEQEWAGRSGLERALTSEIDLVLLDLMLPGIDGLALSRELRRQRPDLPIIMLTARGEREMILQGFISGADDYVTKPFDMDVLFARISARLRGRPAGRPAAAVSPLAQMLDSDAHVLRTDAGEVTLNPKEFDLLELLASAPGHLFPREEIVERIWHYRYLPGSRTLDVHVRRLREKLKAVAAPVGIETVRGVGYRLVERPD